MLIDYTKHIANTPQTKRMLTEIVLSVEASIKSRAAGYEFAADFAVREAEYWAARLIGTITQRPQDALRRV
jgi:hypothetical protein